MTLADDLRALADAIDANPRLSITIPGPYGVYAYSDEAYADTVRALSKIGPVEKRRDDYRFTARTPIGKSFEIIAIDYSGEVACELVQTGERTVEREITKVVGTETVVEPIMEWVCPPSILAGA